MGQSGDEKKMSRPFGVALLIAGCDDLVKLRCEVSIKSLKLSDCTLQGPKLYFCDPSGTYVEYKAKAIGSGSEGAQTTLSEEYSDDLTIQEAESLAIKTLKAVCIYR